MHIQVDDLLLRVLPKGSGRRNSPDFQKQAAGYLRTLFDNLDGVISSISVTRDELALSWNSQGNDPLNGILNLLNKKQFNEAILLLELFKSAEPENRDFLYDLGMAYSDQGDFDRAITNLTQLLGLAPEHINGRVALGVALMRQGQDGKAVEELEKAVQADPENPWAQRNLGACLLRLGKYEEALPHLKQAAELNPTDDRAWYGLGQAYELTGNIEAADSAYHKVIELDEYGDAAEQARKALSKIAQTTFRSAMPGMERMDAVMYCLGALEKFDNMTPDEVRQVGVEVAMIGMNGLDVNDPTQKYHLRSLPGVFSGLHMVCLEYVSFKQFAPEMDIGFDLSAEYKAAQALHEKRKNQGR